MFISSLTTTRYINTYILVLHSMFSWQVHCITLLLYSWPSCVAPQFLAFFHYVPPLFLASLRSSNQLLAFLHYIILQLLAQFLHYVAPQFLTFLHYSSSFDPFDLLVLPLNSSSTTIVVFLSLCSFSIVGTIPSLSPLFILYSFLYSSSLSFVHSHQQLFVFLFFFLYSLLVIATSALLLFFLFIFSSSCQCSSFMSFVPSHQQLLVLLFFKQKVLLLYTLFIFNSCVALLLCPLYILNSKCSSFFRPFIQSQVLFLFAILCSFLTTVVIPLLCPLYILSNNYCCSSFLSFVHSQLLHIFSGMYSFLALHYYSSFLSCVHF